MINTRHSREALRVRWSWLGRLVTASPLAIVVVALLPKCPLCIAALLATCGIAANIADVVAPWAVPLSMIGVVALAATSMPILAKARIRRDRSPNPNHTPASIERARERCC